MLMLILKKGYCIMIPLTKMQLDIMRIFYSKGPEAVVMDKKERRNVWDKVKKRKWDIEGPEMRRIEMLSPALAHQITRSVDTGGNIQSAVFSECVYAQTLANMLGLERFFNCYDNREVISSKILLLLESYGLMPRYAYMDDGSSILIQAGGNNGVDSALIMVEDLNVYTIEFKEPAAKTSEPDLPPYGEDGVIVVSNIFIKNNPQFVDMLNENAGLNILDNVGHNINKFSAESIRMAVSNNYSGSKKYADVICTEDKDGLLVMIPANHVHKWSRMEGEIRTAGRNNYKVWTPLYLRRSLMEIGAHIDDRGVAVVHESRLSERRARGGSSVTGYKINPVMFVRVSRINRLNDGFISFSLNDVRQLRPTIAAKMFFDNLEYRSVAERYFG